MKALSLFELNNLVHEALEATFDHTYWLTAELSECRVAANGHCYVELVEKDDDSRVLIAKARGNIWRNTYPLLATTFEHETGQKLQPGLKILVEAKVTFHELYGYALNIIDIDPTYTLGDMARKRKEILAQLEADGVLTLNKELALPRPLSRIAVISSSTAAGYGDFCDQLEKSPYRFTTRLFPAIMQGEHVEESVIEALDSIAEEQEAWDAVVIIRGGGAVSDLNGFDTYLLAANVAQFPLPILTGIGHERDDTIIDVVAHTRLKTPTAVAAFLIERQRDEYETLLQMEKNLQQNICRKLEKERNRFEQNGRRYQMATASYCHREKANLLKLTSLLEKQIFQLIQQQQFQLNSLQQVYGKAVATQISHEQIKLASIGKQLALAGPERILKMGFSITYHQGKAVKSASLLKSGSRLTTRLAEGSITSTVD
jgi:exodeoxyribonuclease VII large subunit